MTKGEHDLITDANEFVRQTADLTEDIPPTTGIRPHPLVEVSETTLETSRIGLSIEEQNDEPTPASDS